MSWTVEVKKKVTKALKKLPEHVGAALASLTKEIELSGPHRANWKNYGPLSGKKNEEKYHCHLSKGKPTYVACWEVTDKNGKKVEVYYAGTHEKAPY